MAFVRGVVALVVLTAACLAPSRSGGQALAVPIQPGSADRIVLQQDAEKLLHSADPKDRTWGAYLAGRLNFTALLPDLQRLLERSPFGSPLQEKWLTLVALDALIQNRAAVPAEKLLPLREQFPDQVLILLALHPQENSELLLDLLDEPLPDVYRQLLRSTLAQVRAPGFAAHLLRGYRIVATVYVRTPGTGGFGGGSAGGGSEGGVSCTLSRELPADYPPGACYSLGGTLDARPGVSVMMAPFVRPIYYTRTEVAPGSNEYPAATRATRNERFDTETTDYFSALLSRPKDLLPIREYTVRQLEWQGRDDFVEQIERIRGQLRAAYAELLAQLAQAELLTAADDISRLPLVEWNVLDLRETKTEPVPAVE